MKIYVCASRNDNKLDFVDGNLREYRYVDDTILNSNLYSELAVLYEIVENTKDDIIGLEHYRRFFIDTTFEATSEYPFRVINEQQILDTLKDNDIIMTKNYLIKNLISQIYNEPHNPKEYKDAPTINLCLYDWFSFLGKKKAIDFDSIHRYMINSYSYWGNNMFIGKRTLIKEYVDWLFPLLEEFTKTHPHQHRMTSYMGEYIFGFYMMSKNAKIVEGYKATLTKDVSELESYQYYNPKLNQKFFKYKVDEEETTTTTEIEEPLDEKIEKPEPIEPMKIEEQPIE